MRDLIILNTNTDTYYCDNSCNEKVNLAAIMVNEIANVSYTIIFMRQIFYLKSTALFL
jgi:hypothetical protein